MTGEQDVRRPRASYEIRIRGHLGATMLRAFPALHAGTRDGDTLLPGGIADQAALYGALAQIEALGLELIEVRRLPGEPRPTRITRARDAESPGRTGP
jgi:hypothetical protein